MRSKPLAQAVVAVGLATAWGLLGPACGDPGGGISAGGPSGTGGPPAVPESPAGNGPAGPAAPPPFKGFDARTFEPVVPPGWHLIRTLREDAGPGRRVVLSQYESDAEDLENPFGQMVSRQLFINLVDDEPSDGARPEALQVRLDRTLESLGRPDDPTGQRLTRRLVVSARPAAMVEQRTKVFVNKALLVPVNAHQLIEVRSPSLPEDELERIASEVLAK